MDKEHKNYREQISELFAEVSAITFSNGFSLVKGTDSWIGSDSCEYDDPLDYFNEGSPVTGKLHADSNL